MFCTIFEKASKIAESNQILREYIKKPKKMHTIAKYSMIVP